MSLRGEMGSAADREEEEGEEGAGLLRLEVIFCSDEERDGSLGRVGGGGGAEAEGDEGERWRERETGEGHVFRLARLGGLLKALVSEGWKPRAGVRVGVAGVDRDLASPPRAVLALAFCRLSTACMWPWVSSRIFWASS